MKHPGALALLACLKRFCLMSELMFLLLLKHLQYRRIHPVLLCFQTTSGCSSVWTGFQWILSEHTQSRWPTLSGVYL
jgi:hypothetical protein